MSSAVPVVFIFNYDTELLLLFIILGIIIIVAVDILCVQGGGNHCLPTN